LREGFDRREQRHQYKCGDYFHRAILERNRGRENIIWTQALECVVSSGASMTSLKRFVPRPLRPTARGLYQLMQAGMRRITGAHYEDRKEQELNTFACADALELPAIAHYWSNQYLIPMLEPFGFRNALECFRSYLAEVCRARSTEECVFLSIGAGACAAEINTAQWLLENGIRNFRFDCLEINAGLLEQAVRNAEECGVLDRFSFDGLDVNSWVPPRRYHSILAFQSLHHVVELESLFEKIFNALHDDGYFLADDMIGRNGHQRWPEALEIVRKLWKDLPEKYRHNRQLQRLEREFQDWDCSIAGFEGIRSQDILRLLIERFHFRLFVAFGNVIDVFIDRGFGHNFDPANAWDRAFIDKAHAIDVWHLERGLIKPTHMMAVMTKTTGGPTFMHKPFSPAFCVRPTGMIASIRLRVTALRTGIHNDLS
jgi:hypothetical protein